MTPARAIAADARRVVVLGAAGRDFHVFNTVLRDDPSARVVAFTAAQIPGVAGRRYPAGLAGPLYPEGIAIRDEVELDDLLSHAAVDDVVFAYSDVTHAHVMHLAARALAKGASFRLLGPRDTMLRARCTVVAVSAVRTGCGKSQIARHLSRRLRSQGRRVVVLRHPMPYGDLLAERVQRFASLADLDAARCTIEEREEYEPHIAAGNVVFAGVDYRAVLARAEAEADVIVWDGGNNDFPFLAPDLHIVVVDALRPTQLDTHHPGEAVLRMADVVVINKVDAASDAAIEQAIAGVERLNPDATILRAASPVTLEDPARVVGKRVLVVDDGPTLTHGDMPFGAAHVAATRAGAGEIVDPRDSAPPEIAAVFARYPHLGRVLPAVGYGPAQLAGLADTIARSRAEIVVSGTPIDLARLIRSDKPILRARYGFADAGEPTLDRLVDAFFARNATA